MSFKKWKICRKTGRIRELNKDDGRPYMNSRLKLCCDLLCKNAAEVQANFSYASDAALSLAVSSMYTAEAERVNIEELNTGKKLLDAVKNLSDDEPDTVRLAAIASMAVTGKPEEYLEDLKTVLSLLDRVRMKDVEYKLLSALILSDNIWPDDYEEYVRRTKEIYSRMREEHRWLTSVEDMPFAALLSVSGYEVDDLIIEMEMDYDILEKEFPDNNALQTLTHILALYDLDVEEECQKAIRIKELLEKEGFSFREELDVTILGMLTTLSLTAEEIAANTAEAAGYLKEQEFLKSQGKDTSLLSRRFAAQMVLLCHQEEETDEEDPTSMHKIAYSLLRLLMFAQG